MNAPPSAFDALQAALELGGTDLRAWAIAWARALPTVLLVPAFGLRALAAPTRIALGLALAASVAPALTPVALEGRAWMALVPVEMAKGIPVALLAATSLWAAGMAGGLVDNLRGERLTAYLPHVDAGSTPSGALLSMLAALAFLNGGGPARVARHLANPALGYEGTLQRAAAELVAGLEIAIAVAAPLIAVSIVVELASALVARAANPAYIQPFLAPLRSIFLLGALAIVLDRMIELLALYQARLP
jgi:type III secretory pathway component EscT